MTVSFAEGHPCKKEPTWPPPTTEDHLLSSLSTGHTSELPFLCKRFLLFSCFGAESCLVFFF